mgnify:FL=1
MANPIFSTREIAAIFWLVVFCIYILINKEIRKAAYRVIIALGNKYVVFAILSLFVYTSLITYFPLYVCGAWDGSMIKDTCIWFLFTALSLLFNVNKARDFTFFKRIITDNIKVIIIVEFLFNFYTFSLVVELIMLPILTFLIIVQTYAEIYQQQEPKYKATTSYIKKILSLIGYGIFIYVIWMAIKDYGNLLLIYNVKILLLPIFLTLLSIPCFYIVALILEYDSVLTSIKHIWRDNPSVAKDMNKATKRYANINLKSLSRIWKYHALYDPAKDSVSDYIKRILQKSQYTIGRTARLSIFNDIKTVIKRLSKNGIGEFGDWNCFEGNEYSAITDYFLIKNSSLYMPNNLAYYITGKKDYIEKIELVLNINYQQDKEMAMAKFKDITLLTCKSLSINCPQDLVDAMDQLSEYCLKFDTYSLELQCVPSGKVETWTFSIITQI